MLNLAIPSVFFDNNKPMPAAGISILLHLTITINTLGHDTTHTYSSSWHLLLANRHRLAIFPPNWEKISKLITLLWPLFAIKRDLKAESAKDRRYYTFSKKGNFFFLCMKNCSMFLCQFLNLYTE